MKVGKAQLHGGMKQGIPEESNLKKKGKRQDEMISNQSQRAEVTPVNSMSDDKISIPAQI